MVSANLDSIKVVPIAKELVTCDEELSRGAIAEEVSLEMWGPLRVLLLALLMAHPTKSRADSPLSALGLAKECFRRARIDPHMNIDAIHVPDDLDDHRREIWTVTEPLRDMPYHTHSNYSGPWIENWWINEFKDTPTEQFGGLVPVFAQWVDSTAMCQKGKLCNRERNLSKRKEVIRALTRIMRPDVAYITVVQHASGFFMGVDLKGSARRKLTNLLILSSGGVGHIPIPLMKQPHHLEFSNSATPARALTCFGSIDQSKPLRQALYDELKALPPRYENTVRWYYGAQWVRELTNSTFAMIPRGYGRTAFSLYEVIQMGFLPVYVWDDVEWLPYRGSSRADFERFGLSMRIGGLQKTMDNITALRKDAKELAKRRLVVRELAQCHFSYEGIMSQISRLFANGTDPTFGTDLRCTRESEIFTIGWNSRLQKTDPNLSLKLRRRRAPAAPAAAGGNFGL